MITHEVGSLAKPSWRVKPFTNSSLSDHDLEEARFWGKKLKVPDLEHHLKLLSKRANFTADEKARIIELSSLYGIRFQEEAGLDWVWDGEQQRVEMYEYAIQHMKGFKFHGHVRSFDNKYYKKASCVDQPRLIKPYHVTEFQEIERLAHAKVKIPLTGAYTLVDWSYDEFYTASTIPGKISIRKECEESRREFIKDISKDIIYPNIKALYDSGARIIQIDEPAAATKRGETSDLVESVKLSIGDLKGKAFFVIHICFSDYTRLFPGLLELQGIIDEVHFEYANRDTKELGHERHGYEALKLLKNTSFKVGLGVLDVHTDFIEPPELIRDRILYAHSIIQDPDRLYISADCGLRTRSWDVSFKKLRNMVEGRNLALKEIHA